MVKQFLDRFRNMKLRTKLFLSYLLFIILVLATGLLIQKIYKDNTIQVTKTTSQNLVQQLSNNISYKMSAFEINLLYATEASGIFHENDFTNYVNQKKDVNVFNIYLESAGASVSSDLFQNLTGESFYYGKSSTPDYRESNIYQYIQQNKKIVFEAAGKAQYVTFPNEPGIVYAVKADITLDSHLADGIVAVGIGDQCFRSMFPKALADASIVVCDQNSRILMGDENARAVLGSLDGQGLKNIGRENDFKYQGKNIVVESSVSDDSRWNVLYVISLNDLLSGLDNVQRLVWILCIALLLFSVAVAYWVSDAVTSNLRMLLEKIKSVEQGDFTDKLTPKSGDEMAVIFRHFNLMSDRLNDLVNRLAYEKIETQRAEYHALLAQINPHFLYNALESINGLAKIKEQDDIVRIISSLSSLMRVSLSSRNSIVKLRDELNYVDDYISIQKVITGGRISVEYDIEDGTQDCSVPKLILQPIVENAVNYGIGDKKCDALILVSAHRENGVLKINISDNGNGIEPEKLKKILAGLNEAEQPDADAHAHIGLKSVNQRLRILFGAEYGLQITSVPGEGTVVELSLPTDGEKLMRSGL